ncbi:hypothetical protein P7K49_002321 [Saguinus oedipus]|uniref:Secreted protein n=1 Tax=Saguinus oedipus TaxID=9490 RepID=A0ABQ9WH04_SAGOE|nr:hypothetical protein P7K49_002321 [Saguinus oedipus]
MEATTASPKLAGTAWPLLLAGTAPSLLDATASLRHDSSSAPWDRATASSRRFRSLPPHHQGFRLLQRRRGFCQGPAGSALSAAGRGSDCTGSSFALRHRLSLCPAPEVDERHPVSPPGSRALEIAGVEP